MVRAESVTATLVYTYAADGLRVAQSVASTGSAQGTGDETTFAWDWASGLPEMLSAGGTLYLLGHDTLGRWDGAAWVYHLPDGLGSVRQEVDGAGAVIAAREWTPYGVEVGGAQAGPGYTGEWWDGEVGLEYLRARWYGPEVGRFTRRDPWSGNVRQPGTIINPYLYGSNNPLLYTDPGGKWCIAGFDVGPGPGCTGQQREQWAAIWNTTAGFFSSPAFVEGFALEFLDSVLLGGVSIPSFVFEHWLNRTNSYPLHQFLTQLMLLNCSSGPESYEALRAPYSYLFNRPDPYFQLGRAIGRVTALGMAVGEIGVSVTGGGASVAVSATGIGVPLGAGGLALSAGISAHAVGVIGVVVVKEMADHLVMSVATGGLPGGGGGGGAHSVGSHKEMKRPVGDDLDSHHIVQDAWARRKGIPGYSREDAMAIRLTGTEHSAVNGVQRAFRLKYGWNTTLQQELQMAREALQAAGLSSGEIDAAIEAAAQYFASLGVQ